jgi:lipopolysaccharide transport system permease protein
VVSVGLPSAGSGAVLPAADRGDFRKPAYVCRPGHPPLRATLREVWQFRRLLYIFIQRDLKVRYKHTVIGAGWNILQPLGMMAVFTLVFGVLFTLRTRDVPYPLFVYPALLLWQFFSRGMTQAGTCLETFQSILDKIYFPRIIAPLSFVLSALVDFAVASVTLIALMFVYGVWPTWHILLAPLFVGLALLVSLGLGIWLSAIDASYKDVRHTLSFVTQFWMFATPVVYPMSMVPDNLRPFYVLNPMVGIIEGFRWSVTGGTSPPESGILLFSFIFGLLVLYAGTRYFNAHQGILMDRI